jgi:hypothetical protein
MNKEKITPIDTLQIPPAITAENSVNIGRNARGRFTNGNNFSVGNKGGRPKNLSLEEWLNDTERLESICDKAVNGDSKSLNLILDMLDGKMR